MTFTYFKVAPASEPGQAGLNRCGPAENLLAHRRRPNCRRIDGERWQGPVFGAGESAWTPGVARKSNAAYILQKDPDGRWYLDQWKDNAAAAIRPFAASRQDGVAAAASAEAGLLFIIEIT